MITEIVLPATLTEIAVYPEPARPITKYFFRYFLFRFDVFTVA
jgi:hypothetical protein